MQAARRGASPLLCMTWAAFSIAASEVELVTFFKTVLPNWLNPCRTTKTNKIVRDRLPVTRPMCNPYAKGCGGALSGAVISPR